MGSFDLVETMPFDPHEGIVDLELHLANMKASAEALGSAFDRHDARNELQAATFRARVPKMLRLVLSPTGAIAIESRDLPAPPDEPVSILLRPLPLAEDDVRLRHKTTDNRALDAARREAGAYEVLFVDADGWLARGSFTNVFVERAGTLLTPPLERAMFASVLRQRLIADGHAREADLKREDLDGPFQIGNAMLGLVGARLVT